MKYKVGDLVKVVANTSTDTRYDQYIGQENRVVGVEPNDPYPYTLAGWSVRMCEKELNLVQKHMNLLEKFTSVFKSEPQKSFNKAGITNGDDTLTSDGQTVFLSWLLQEHGDDFKAAVVDKLLEDQKDNE